MASAGPSPVFPSVITAGLDVESRGCSLLLDPRKGRAPTSRAVLHVLALHSWLPFSCVYGAKERAGLNSEFKSTPSISPNSAVSHDLAEFHCEIGYHLPPGP
jgi:hypothetical protein